jgi:rod shape-determining protein MreC
VGVAGLVVGGFLLIVSTINPQFLSGLRGIGGDAAEPVGAVSAEGRADGFDIIATLAGYFKAAGNYAKLERELDEAKVRLAEADAIAAENRRLKGLLGLTQGEPKPVAVTYIASSTATSTRRYATIGAGSRDGVRPGMPVRSLHGLIGRVLEVGATSARLLLVTDASSLVPVRRAKDGLPAFAQGGGDGTLRIKLINLGVNPIRKGDVFVTSGSGGLYRPGTAIAVADRIVSDGAVASILSDPAATEYVIVEPVWAPEAQAEPVNGARQAFGQ